jgi:Gas vesicle synthesis protein GvpL/GvpF
VLYVYAFVEAPAAVPEIDGIDSARLATERASGLDAVVSRHEQESVEASESAIVAHARVVDAVAESNAAVLPARFGGMHADAEALRGAVAERAAALAAALTRVRGCVEFGLRVLAPAAEPASPSTGAAYMHARLEQRRATERVADELHAPLTALAREATRTVGATPRLLLSAAYLVPRNDASAFRDAVERVQSAHPALSIVCTGPWPAYSFATAEAATQ